MTSKEKELLIVKKLVKLSKIIDKHNYHYHTEDKPIISDREYDQLVKENLDLEKKYPNLKLDSSPNNKVGSKIKNILLPLIGIVR